MSLPSLSSRPGSGVSSRSSACTVFPNHGGGGDRAGSLRLAQQHSVIDLRSIVSTSVATATTNRHRPKKDHPVRCWGARAAPSRDPIVHAMSLATPRYVRRVSVLGITVEPILLVAAILFTVLSDYEEDLLLRFVCQPPAATTVGAAPDNHPGGGPPFNPAGRGRPVLEARLVDDQQLWPTNLCFLASAGQTGDTAAWSAGQTDFTAATPQLYAVWLFDAARNVLSRTGGALVGGCILCAFVSDAWSRRRDAIVVAGALLVVRVLLTAALLVSRVDVLSALLSSLVTLGPGNVVVVQHVHVFLLETAVNSALSGGSGLLPVLCLAYLCAGSWGSLNPRYARLFGLGRVLAAATVGSALGHLVYFGLRALAIRLAFAAWLFGLTVVSIGLTFAAFVTLYALLVLKNKTIMSYVLRFADSSWRRYTVSWRACDEAELIELSTLGGSAASPDADRDDGDRDAPPRSLRAVAAAVSVDLVAPPGLARRLRIAGLVSRLSVLVMLVCTSSFLPLAYDSSLDTLYPLARLVDLPSSPLEFRQAAALHQLLAFGVLLVLQAFLRAHRARRMITSKRDELHADEAVRVDPPRLLPPALFLVGCGCSLLVKLGATQTEVARLVDRPTTVLWWTFFVAVYVLHAIALAFCSLALLFIATDDACCAQRPPTASHRRRGRRRQSAKGNGRATTGRRRCSRWTTPPGDSPAVLRRCDRVLLAQDPVVESHDDVLLRRQRGGSHPDSSSSRSSTSTSSSPPPRMFYACWLYIAFTLHGFVVGPAAQAVAARVDPTVVFVACQIAASLGALVYVLAERYRQREGARRHRRFVVDRRTTAVCAV